MQRTNATEEIISNGAAFWRKILNRTGWAGWLAITLFLLLAQMAQAQFRASIQGVVADNTGAVIPGATLTLTDTSTNKVLVSTSNGEGVYNFNALPPDHFTLVVEMKGFQKKVLDNVQLNPEESNALNVELDISAQTSTVTVDA